MLICQMVIPFSRRVSVIDIISVIDIVQFVHDCWKFSHCKGLNLGSENHLLVFDKGLPLNTLVERKMKVYIGGFKGAPGTPPWSFVFRWFKFTLKPPNSMAPRNFFLAIWDTSHWNFFVKFGLKTPYDIS